ncbi:TonB-dependent receptor [Fusobacterium nucleatum subsp. nucleatum ATCC 25586]|uniref:Hemin receptor n=1 Tax=Fusobacterium nucleatum subsp. nucleatum (strain ATCC 25586 / DSM 15643 / BCRC 10681 / CIP 101130 / JCM 8532 / KCTC 2640 / LMG 13131 / VPI 4355) TaxID=190304 RepID=Q8RG20_FUSNN|nr:Hemin receptor [Fusobacterium nucleatum subsp. nucleatum ATCC 25586]AVQ15912.1 TonB-dependent receptor [Fusobacterium nucleatum subsp. nucleatum ATCC 25586]
MLTILSSIIAYAEDTIELNQTTVKGSKTSDYTAPPKEQKNTFVITQERIREKNYKNVEDILRDAPGVVVQNTAFGPRIDMRGSGEKSLSRVKVLVDGVSINPTEETMASLPINAIPVESIKKIEIIPGGGATLYGSGSVGGVVSISTNSNVTKDNFFMDLNYGSYDNRNFGFAGGYNFNKNLYVNYGFSYLNSEDYREHEEKENKIYLLGFDYKINAKNRFRFQTRFSDIKQDSSNQIPVEELKNNRRKAGLNMDIDTKDRSYTFDYEYRPTQNVTLSTSLYKQEQDRDIDTESIDDIKIIASNRRFSHITQEKIFYDVKSEMQAKFEEDKKGLKIKAKFDYNLIGDNASETILGFDYQTSTNKRNSLVQSETLKSYYDSSFGGFGTLGIGDRLPIINKIDMKMTKKSSGIYAFNKWGLTDKVDMTFGGRIEKTQYNGYRENGPNIMPFISPEKKRIETDEKLTNYAGELGFLYKYNDTGRTYVRYERGFVTPFGNQLTDKIHDTELKNKDSGIIVPPAVNAASKYVANNLKSEKTDTFEIGFRDYIFGSSISTSFFLTDTTDEITLISSGVTNPAVNRWKYRNIGKTRRMGIEFEAEQNIGKFRFNQSLTLVNTKVLKSNDEARIEKGDRVPMVPRLKATLGVKYNFTDRLSGYLNYVYLAKQETRELRENTDITKDDVIVKHTIGGHGTLEAGLSYKPDNYSDIKIGAKNILSNKYNLRETSLEALPAPKRNYYLQLNVRF